MINKVVITSGPTVEPIDPVRYISNRSSGKSGFHLANEARKRGIADICFITGPTRYIPSEVRVIQVERALEMREKLIEESSDAQVIIMAAAVGDYRVAEYRHRKIKKSEETLTLHLVKNPDLLAELGKKKGEFQVLVGYAAETDHIQENARDKLQRKNLDLLVLNQVSEHNPAFNVDYNQVFLLTPVSSKKLPSMDKSEIAQEIWEEIYHIEAQKSHRE